MMSIKKTLLLASMALAAIALMAPAAAQATIKLTDPDGTALKAGAKFTATSIPSNPLITTTEAGTLKCAEVTLHLELKNNGSNHLLIEQIGEATTAGCVLDIGIPELPTTITDGTLGVGEEGTLTINTWGTGTTTATFVSHTYEDAGHTKQVATCHFTGPVHVTPTHETDILHVNGGLHKTTGEESCPAPGGEIHGTLTLETPDKTPIKIDFTTTP